MPGLLAGERGAGNPGYALVAGQEPTDSLAGLYVQAALAGQAGKALALFKGLAAFRPAVTDPSELGSLPGRRGSARGRPRPP